MLEEFYRNENIQNSVRLDYIGPQIDIGFRLCGLATPSQLVISLEIAALISEFGAVELEKLPASFESTFNHQFLPITSRQAIKLKGALEDKRYPIFFIELDRYEQVILNKRIASSVSVVTNNSLDIDQTHDRFLRIHSYRLPEISSYCKSVLRLLQSYILLPSQVIDVISRNEYEERLGRRARAKERALEKTPIEVIGTDSNETREPESEEIVDLLANIQKL